MRAGQIAEKTRKKILVKDGSAPLYWTPPNYGHKHEMLRSDFLLVSRIPTTSMGGSLLSFAGGHGAGTEALSHLFDERVHISALKDLFSALNGNPYWQFVLEVTEVDHPATGTVPRRVIISEKLPPRILDVSASALPDLWYVPDDA
jgi:hypothetical protein